MWFLHPFRLIDSPTKLVIISLKYSFILRPHCQNHLDGFTQLAQAGWSIWEVIAVCQKFLFMPTCTNAKIQAPMTECVYGACHLCQQSRIAVSVACDHLTDAYPLCIASQRSG